jgi:hypothetical protein
MIFIIKETVDTGRRAFLQGVQIAHGHRRFKRPATSRRQLSARPREAGLDAWWKQQHHFTSLHASPTLTTSLRPCRSNNRHTLPSPHANEQNHRALSLLSLPPLQQPNRHGGFRHLFRTHHSLPPRPRTSSCAQARPRLALRSRERPCCSAPGQPVLRDRVSAALLRPQLPLEILPCSVVARPILRTRHPGRGITFAYRTCFSALWSRAAL